MKKLTKAQIAGPWTHFWDMNSGGSQKTKFAHIFIQLPCEEAIELFEQRFHRDPHNVTCDCCGNDFDIQESEDLLQATGYFRKCVSSNSGYIESGQEPNYQTIDQFYKNRGDEYEFIFKT